SLASHRGEMTERLVAQPRDIRVAVPPPPATRAADPREWQTPLERRLPLTRPNGRGRYVAGMRLWRRARGWLLFGGATVLGAGCGVAAGYLLSDRLAGTVVGVVTAVAGVLGARGKALLESRSARRAALPGQVLAGRLARVREL